jgi:hypothetical protein
VSWPVASLEGQPLRQDSTTHSNKIREAVALQRSATLISCCLDSAAQCSQVEQQSPLLLLRSACCAALLHDAMHLILVVVSAMRKQHTSLAASPQALRSRCSAAATQLAGCIGGSAVCCTATAAQCPRGCGPCSMGPAV